MKPEEVIAPPSKVTLGCLESVSVRDIWPDEASDFTPWLARPENMNALGDVLGIPLELERVEAVVGNFWADIVARNAADGNSIVVIENQLAQTDHSHLGQLLTYLAGLDARTVVWITQRVRDEHRAALEWLNKHTEEGFRFFAVEIELWRISGSPPAPRFHVSVKPNDWVRAERAHQVHNSEAGAEYLAFWTRFKDWLSEHRPDIQTASPNRTSNLWIPVPGTPLALSLFRAKTGVGLFVRAKLSGSDAQAQAHALIAPLYSVLREKLGTSDSPDARYPLRSDKTCNPNEPSEWNSIYAWFSQMAERYSKVLKEAIGNS